MLRPTTLLLVTLLASCQAPPTSAMRDASGMLLPGSPCPRFQALDTEGNLVTDADLAGRRTVLWFYPKAATPG